MIYETDIDITEIIIKEMESNISQVKILIVHLQYKIVFYDQIKFCLYLNFWKYLAQRYNVLKTALNIFEVFVLKILLSRCKL